MLNDIAYVLLSAQEIEKRVSEIEAQINSE